MEIKLAVLAEAGPTTAPCANALGTEWHNLLDKSLKGQEMTEYEDKYVAAAESLFEILEDKMNINPLESEFPLYGYMKSKSELSQEVYLWQGNADAIGLLYNKKRKRFEYVIVDWKITRDLLGFWDSPKTFGMHLHQCLVYAKLLKIHLNLYYLPSVLIVPISSDNGKLRCSVRSFL